MENALELQKQKPLTPGIAVGGVVFCPFFKGACLKGGCELFVELKQGEQYVARCTFSWMSVLSTEVRGAIDRIKNEPSKGNSDSTSK